MKNFTWILIVKDLPIMESSTIFLSYGDTDFHLLNLNLKTIQNLRRPPPKQLLAHSDSPPIMPHTAVSTYLLQPLQVFTQFAVQVTGCELETTSHQIKMVVFWVLAPYSILAVC
jgi:hypothetical protein